MFTVKVYGLLCVSKCKRTTYLEFCTRLILSSCTVPHSKDVCWLCISLLSVAIRSNSTHQFLRGLFILEETLRNGNVFDFCSMLNVYAVTNLFKQNISILYLPLKIGSQMYSVIT